MIPRVPLREALSDPNLLGTAIAGNSWGSGGHLIPAMGEELREDSAIFSLSSPAASASRCNVSTSSRP